MTVTDDKGVTPAGAQVPGGTDGDGVLDLTETWIFKATGTAIAGHYNNIGNAEGYGPAIDKVTATDPSSYFGSGRPDRHREGTSVDGPYHLGGPGTWTYTGSNKGTCAHPRSRSFDEHAARHPCRGLRRRPTPSRQRRELDG